MYLTGPHDNCTFGLTTLPTKIKLLLSFLLHTVAVLYLGVKGFKTIKYLDFDYVVGAAYMHFPFQVHTS